MGKLVKKLILYVAKSVAQAKMLALWTIVTVAFGSTACAEKHGPVDFDADVLVYGATPGGLAAAVSAAKSGHSVLLIEPTDRIGGLLTSGLSYTDFRSFESLTGFFWDFARRVEADYARRYGPDSPQVKDCFRGTHGEPSVNLRILHSWLAEYSALRLINQYRLQDVTVSSMRDGRQRIMSLVITSGDGSVKTARARMYIDASYEGDLMAKAGEPYHVGRESREQYGEPQAGDAHGLADGQVQGYNFRFIMTQVETNKLMPVAPDGYDRDDFTGVLDHFASGRLKNVFASGRDGIYRAHLPLLPNGKADVNDTPHAPVRLSMPDLNDGYPEGDQATRQRIIQQHGYYNVGLLYFLQNDPEVPPAIRADACSWGWCRDEFVETGGLPPQLYIREARRMVGQHVFSGNDTKQLADDARSVLHRDSIACADYVHNCHGTGRTGTRFDGNHTGEFYKPVPPYQIPFGVIVPQRSENLLVPVACSASHFGFGALRLEPIWCSLGQATGWCAHLALESDCAVQAVDIARLQAALHHDRSATIYVSDVPPESPEFAAVQWFATQGGLHGLAGPEQPKPESLGGQYCQAHPGHRVELDRPLDAGLRARWNRLTPLPAPDEPTTRRDWILQAYRIKKGE